MKHTRKILSIILALAAAGCLAGAGVIYLRGLQDDRAQQEVLGSLRPLPETPESETNPSESTVDTSESTAGTSESTVDTLESTAGTSSQEEPPSESTGSAETKETEETVGTEETVPSKEEPLLTENPYANYFLANSDMAAWLQIPGTVIDYPVMWTPEDEEYYLYRGFDKKDNKNGCLILDTDSSLDPLTTNLIIHGHNMKSGAMFGDLTDYEKKSYFEEHRQITLYTPECRRNYEVIAVFRSQVFKKTDRVFKFYQFFQADTEEEFLDFYDNIKNLSLYDTGVTAQFGDHFITLSTCVYHVENGRFVVVAKEVEEGDFYLPLE